MVKHWQNKVCTEYTTYTGLQLIVFDIYIQCNIDYPYYLGNKNLRIQN